MSETAWSSPEAFQLTSFRCPAYGDKKCDKRASEASKVHPRVGDWIEAAPVLVCALDTQRYYQGLFDLALQRGKVVDALRLVALPTPLRKLPAPVAAGWSNHTAWREAVCALGDSEVAQLIPKMDGQFHRHLATIWRARSKIQIGDFERHQEFSRWAVRTSAAETLDAIHLALDFMAANPFELSWSIARFRREHHAWVERMRHVWAAEREAMAEIDAAKRSAAQQKYLTSLDVEIDFGARPLTAAINGVDFAATNTLRKLIDEGHAMRHCVGGQQYRVALRKGTAFFYHLVAGSERSTLEIQYRRGVHLIGQHCGPCNQRPHAALQIAASELVRRLNEAAA